MTIVETMDQSQSLHGLFLEASKSFPTKPAVIFDDGTSPVQVVDYRTLAALSAKLASELRCERLGHNRIVAVSGNNYDQVVIAILSILQVPAAFVFIPPDAPTRRTSDLLSRLNVSLLITTCPELSEGLSTALKTSFHISTKTLDISGRASFTLAALDLGDGNSNVPAVVTHPLAYVVCTSGTTGRPKVVRVPHRCIVPNITHLRSIFNVTSSDVIFNASPLTFDPSIVEMFLAFSTGATLVTVADEVKRSPNHVLSAIIKHKVTVLQVTPSFLYRMNQEQLRTSILSEETELRVLALGGEPCPSLVHLSKWRHHSNKTEIFNLYGITEVSSWASCYRLNEFDTRLGRIPLLGQPLWETVLEVRDETGAVVTQGEGRLYIGSNTRICYIDDEVSFPEQGYVFRDSGDHVRITDSGLVFIGRRNDQFKRFGKRFSLMEVKKVIETHSLVLQCEMALDTSHDPARLYAFFVPSCASDNSEEIEITESCQRLRGELKDELPEEGLPDYVFVIRALPLTDHGKVGRKCLTRWAQDYLEGNSPSKASSRQMTGEEFEELVESYFKEALSLTDVPLNKQKTLIELGGTSFQAVTLVQRLEKLCGETDVALMDSILHQKIADVFIRLISGRGSVCKEIISLPPDKLIEGAESLAPQVAERIVCAALDVDDKIGEEEEEHREDVRRSEMTHDPVNIFHEEHQSTASNDNSKEVIRETTWSKRKRRKRIHHGNDSNEAVWTLSRGSCVTCYIETSSTTAVGSGDQQPAVVLEEDWKANLEKCIDASPLIVMDDKFPHAVVFIGSHSGLFIAMDTTTGKTCWQSRLPDRIESSACLSPCRNFVVVGCYDNNVHFLNRYDGSVYWSFPTNGMVKSSPAASSDSGLVYVGSHDGKVYALNPVTKTCSFSVDAGGGSIFSSPCIDALNQAVYVATLSGKLLCISWTAGECEWFYQCPKPLFSSPAVTSTGVVIGCVDGYIYFISHVGKLVYRIPTEAPIFSSPCVVSSKEEEAILIGSHDGHIYCLTNGSIRWRTSIGEHVYSTPSCIFNGAPPKADSNLLTPRSASKAKSILVTDDMVSDMSWRNSIVACCSTDGVFAILDLVSGESLMTLRLPGELFSSPVFTSDGRIIVACRNDNLYCFSLSSLSSPNC